MKRGYKPRRGLAEKPLLDRLFLHAARIAFADVGGARVDVAAPLPRDLEQALARLSRFAASRRS